MHLGQRGGALCGRRRTSWAAVAGPVGGGVETAGVATQIVHGRLHRRRRVRRRDRQGVDVDVAAVGGGALDTDRVAAGVQADVGRDRRPVVPAARRGQGQGLHIGPVDDQIDRAGRGTAEGAEVVGVAQRHHGLPGGRTENRPVGAGLVALPEIGDEAGDALVARVVGLDVRGTDQLRRAGIAHLVERALVLPLRADRTRARDLHRGVVRAERPRPEPVAKRGLRRPDRQPASRGADAVEGNGEAPVEHVDGRGVLERPARRVLHADQPVAQDLEARVAGGHDRLPSRLRRAKVDPRGQVDGRGRRTRR